jgi:hypothetical protein
MTTKQAHLTIRSAQRQAREVLTAHKKSLAQRESAIRQKTGRLGASRPLTKTFTLAGGLLSSDILLAEGDSWFDYPFNDVLKILEDQHGFDVESVAHKGDAIEQMAYSAGQLDNFTRQLAKLIQLNRPPRAILLSGGGNDVAGVEFAMMLNHFLSAAPGLNLKVMEGVIERLKLAYTFIVAAVTAVCEEKLGRKIPVIVHGYDYPVPDGRGFLGGWPFPGPWLEPGFRAKGYSDLLQRIGIVKGLIDALNNMLNDLTRVSQFAHLRYVDLRKTLSTGTDYKKWWANELHPTKKGFELVAAKIAAAL